tara:strand:- start:18 stop:500 length:483 start_codon:yes stop_codon:yes gene_type:complete
MEQSNQPKKATPEQNAEFNRQLRDVLIGNGIALENTSTEGRDKYTVIGEETYKGLFKTIKLLAENTNSTNQIWNNMQNGIKGNTDSLSTHKDRLLEHETRLNAMQLHAEKTDRSLEPIIIDCSLIPKLEKRIIQLENENNKIHTDYKMLVDRVNKLEKLK